MLSSILARTISAVITDENENYLFAQTNGLTFRILKNELDIIPVLGSKIRGFAYVNENHYLQMTTLIPKNGIDKYAWATVVKVQHNLGVFVDIGLSNKDILISKDLLPVSSRLWPSNGDRLMVSLVIGKKNRIWGKLATRDMFNSISNKASIKMKNNDILATVYDINASGFHVITSDSYVLGFIHISEFDIEPHLGETVRGRVTGINSYGNLNISLKPRAFEAINEDSKMILAALKHANEHKLPFTDHSTPQEIKNYFGISKGAFKRAVGSLLKNQKIYENDNFLILNCKKRNI